MATQQTAREAYEDAKARVLQELKMLQAMVDADFDNANADINWLHVGEVGRVRDTLIEINDLLHDRDH